MPMALTDPNLPGNPIVFANESFLKLSGYSMEEVLGQEPHFMNGRNTDPKDKARFSEAIRSDQDDIIETVQYRKNGTRFVATVLISAFKDDEGRVLNHFMSWLDVTRRVDAEDELSDVRAAEAVLSDDLRITKILHDLGARLVSEDNLQTIYEEILSAAIEITRSKAGTVQMLDPETDELVVIAKRGFSEEAEDYFRRIDARSNTSCGAALRLGERAYFNFDPASTDESARLHVQDGILSAQSTPLISRSGEPIGMVSTHWGELNHRASDRQLRFLDLLARQAADLLEHRAYVEALSDSERHANTLLAELQHRVRNTLAVVRSIARGTAETTGSSEEMLSHFQGRLDAFSRVQAAVTRSADGTVNLKSLIEDELVAYAAREGDQVRIFGDDVALQAKAAERISLAVHELTTNAVKHGALIDGTGRLDIHWAREDLRGSAFLKLKWSESGVDLQNTEITHEGFGMDLLRRTLAYDLDAETRLELLSDGLKFELLMPMRALAEAS